MSAESEPARDATDSPPQRERWGSRITFIVASIGCCVGLGNFWRFPGLAVEHGGAPFLIPYFLAVIFIGVPVMIFEMSIGQIFQGGAVHALGSLNKRFRGLGIAGGYAAFGISLYYISVLAIGLQYFLVSIFSGLPVSFDSSNVALCDPLDEVTCGTYPDECLFQFGKCSAFYTKTGFDYYYDTTGYVVEGNDLSISLYMFLSLLALWVIIVLCLFRGTTSVGIVAYPGMIIPIVLLLAFAIRGLTLEGSSSGVITFLGNFDASRLLNPKIYTDATAQIFLSFSLAYACIPAYNSYNNRHKSIVADGIIIAASNSTASFIAGLAVYTMAGYVAVQSNTVDENGDYIYRGGEINGPNLIFVLYPVGLSMLGLANLFGALFFLCFLMLGLDSAFSQTESLATILIDCRLYRRTLYTRFKRMGIVAPLCLISFLLSLLYGCSLGEKFLSTADDYINSALGPIMGLLETILCGWVYGREVNNARIGSKASLILATSFFGSVFSMAFFFFVIPIHFALPLCLGLFVLIGGGVLAVYCSAHYSGYDKRYLTMKERIYYTFIGNVEQFRALVNNTTASRSGDTKVPMIFAPLIKFVAPLMILMVLAIKFGPDGNFGKVGDLPAGYQAYALFFWFTLPLIVIIVSFFSPEVFDFITPEESVLLEMADGKSNSKITEFEGNSSMHSLA